MQFARAGSRGWHVGAHAVRAVWARPLVLAALLLSAALSGCGGGGGDVAGDDESQPRFYAIGGTISGLRGTGLVLQNNGGDDLAIAANGGFTFSVKLAPTTPYAVTVRQQPAGQRCQVDRGSGVVAFNVTDIAVACADVSAAVLPLYPAHGADWNDHVQDDGATALTASDQACTAGACLHGGELRVWRVPQLASCAGLVVGDALDAFDWVCSDAGGSVAMFSTGLKAGRGLADLLDFDALQWRENQVLVSGAASLASPRGRWWARPIEAAGSASLDLPHVYLVRADTRATFSLDADRAALVVRPGVVLQGPGGGEVVITTGGLRRHLWIEGTIDAAGASRGVHLQQTSHAVLRALEIRNAGTGLAIDWSDDNLIAGVRVSENTGAGIDLGALGGSKRNRFVDIVAVHNGGDGLQLGHHPRTAPGNTARRVLAANNAGLGVLVMRQPDTRLEDVTAFANGTGGVSVLESASAWLARLTVANNDGIGLAVSGADVTLHQVSVVNNAGSGLFLAQVSFRAVDVATVANGEWGLYMTSAAATYGGVLKLGGNAGGDCMVGLGSTGLVNGSCANADGSDAVLTRGVAIGSSFVGKVTSDDAANASDTVGGANFAAIGDWLHFDRPQRGWGADGAAFPDASHRGRCTTGSCRIWDWSLGAGDAVLRAPWALPSGDDVLVHRWSARDATACQAVAGATWDSAALRCTSTLLRHAVEIGADGRGNDNGLCESGERCRFTPNLGSYQGHGAWVDAGDIVAGTLGGIRLLRPADNGY